VNCPDANYCVKRMTLNPGFRCSTHYHCKKDETFIVIEGSVWLNVNGTHYLLVPGNFHRVKPFDIHYFETLQTTPAVFYECSTYHSDADTVRMSDSVKL
jgi:mannose-6-phosphate isomerase-like protein (cupin superfamily)